MEKKVSLFRFVHKLKTKSLQEIDIFGRTQSFWKKSKFLEEIEKK